MNIEKQPDNLSELRTYPEGARLQEMMQERDRIAENLHEAFTEFQSAHKAHTEATKIADALFDLAQELEHAADIAKQDSETLPAKELYGGLSMLKNIRPDVIESFFKDDIDEGKQAFSLWINRTFTDPAQAVTGNKKPKTRQKEQQITDIEATAAQGRLEELRKRVVERTKGNREEHEISKRDVDTFIEDLEQQIDPDNNS